MKTLAKQHKQLTILFGNMVMKAKTETELIAGCHGGTEGSRDCIRVLQHV